MGAADLVNKLMEIERAVGKSGTVEMRGLVLEAQGYVLEIQRQMIETLRENARLRERMEKYEPTSRARIPRLPSHAEIARELAGKLRPVAEETTAVAALHLAAS